jgi:predicted nucleotidyltransferase
MTRRQVLERLRPEAVRLREEFGVKSLALFGSVARDEATEASDIDLLVEFDRPVGLFHLVRTQQFLEGLLGRSVDLVTEGGLKPRARARVLAEAVHVG